ncbi:hypothetical protein [Brachybacterium sp. GPGPB12]|uniref:hypothetical protein n=1 Tax=Brachybacterium sp. GPGPB12 TaxID=3023517 RepID=UPI0031345BBA
MFRRGGRLRAVRPGTVDAALELALRDPVTNALGGARRAGDRPLRLPRPGVLPGGR